MTTRSRRRLPLPALLAAALLIPLSACADERAETRAPKATTSERQVGAESAAADVHTHAAAEPAAASAALTAHDRRFIETALASSQAEVELGRLAQRKGGTDFVRQFGEMMEVHHQRVNRELAALSPQHSVEQAKIGDEHRRRIDRLAQIDDPQQFDRQYAELMIEMHRDDIEAFDRVAGDERYSPQVRRLADRKIDELRTHLQFAQRMQQEVGRVAAVED